MNGKTINYILITVFSIFILTFGFIFINNFDSSYAYSITTATYPTSDFTTNYNNSTINYIKDALTSDGSNTNYDNSFNVPDTLGTSTGNNTLYLLQRNLSIPASSEKFEILAENPTTISDNGIIYIINHGYNSFNKLNHIFTETSEYGVIDVKKKYYVTQIALWLYISENESKFSDICANNACKFVNDSGNVVDANTVRALINKCSSYNNYKFLKYITKLVDDAKIYKGNTESPEIDTSGADRLTYELSSDKKYVNTSLESTKILKGADKFLYYSFEIEDPDNIGIFLTDNNGKKLNPTSIYPRDFGFKICIPLRDNMESINLGNVVVRIVGHFVSDNPIRNYRVTDSSNGLLLPAPLKSQKYSNVLLATVQEAAYEVRYYLTNFVVISKVDITNSKELPGAKLKITNTENNNYYDWVSTDIPKYIALGNGNYTLCEEVAPEGYKKKEECISFTVDGNHVVSLKMENEPILEVTTPNTSLLKGKFVYIFGILLILSGLGVFVITNRKASN